MSESVKRTCPNCGISLEEFHRTGLLGCARCYAAFRSEIMPYVRRIQGETRYMGKAPTASARTRYDLLLERAGICEALAQANREGRYADAERMERRLNEIAHALKSKEGLS